MADAKISIQTLVDNKELQELNKDFAEGSQKLKKLQTDLKQAEKQFGVTSDEAKKLRQELEMQRTVNRELVKGMNRTTRELTNQAKAFDQAAQGGSKLSSFAKQFGVDLDGIIGKLGSTTGLIAGLAAAATAVGTALISSGREVSALSNQFISFAGNAKQAEKMYALFNDVYRNTNYDEQKVYDMAKGLMRIGVSAKEAAGLIQDCADAAAHFGQGAEFADQLAQTLAKVKVGGELTQKQLVELAKAGIDLSDVQEEIKAGGERAYEALKAKVGEYSGAMDASKKTAAEMEGDIKGNLVEIGRQTALLIDDIFGFSEALKSFYQWVIDTSQMVINKLRDMRNTLAQNVAAADEYSRALKEWEDIYGDSFQGSDNERRLAASAYANACADIAKEKKAEAQETEKLIALESKRAQVTVGSVGGRTSSGGGHSASVKAPKEEKAVDPIAEAIKEHQAKLQMETDLLNYKLASGVIEQEAYAEMMQAKTDLYNAWIQEQLASDQLSEEQRYALYKAYSDKKYNYEKKQSDNVNAFTKQWASNISTAFTDAIMGAKSFGEAFKEILKGLLQQLIQCAIYALIISACMPGGVSKNFGSVFKKGMGFADGGPVMGGGTSTSDSIPARLSNGEYVLNARAVEAIGVDNLNRMNFGSQNYAEGGAVGGTGNNITLNVSAMDASGFSDFLSRGGFDAIKDAFSNDERMLGTLATPF